MAGSIFTLALVALAVIPLVTRAVLRDRRRPRYDTQGGPVSTTRKYIAAARLAPLDAGQLYDGLPWPGSSEPEGPGS